MLKELCREPAKTVADSDSLNRRTYVNEACPGAVADVPSVPPLRLCAEVGPAEAAEMDEVQPAPRFAVPSARRLHAVVGDVRAGRKVRDCAFDAIYPQRIRELSRQHWTPIDVARRAARMLAVSDETRVLDVGSGAGKFCLVAALTAPGRFVGIERRGHLVELARSIGAQYGAHRAEYLHGDIAELDWGTFDAFYFYNPFVENLFGCREWIDSTVDLAPTRYAHDVTLTNKRLAKAREGTRVVTYHGPRAALPWGYELADFEPCGTDALELWIKVRA